MKRTEWLQETRMLRFGEALEAWTESRLTQEEAARLLGVCSRTFRRYVDRYEESGIDGLVDKRVSEVSALRAPVDEVVRLEALYRDNYRGWSVAHFHERYRDRHAGERSYTWVKNRLRESGLVEPGKRRGTPRRRRERAAIPGLLVHQDGSSHEWVAGSWWDLIVTMDDATSEVYSGFFVEEEGTWSSLRGVRETLEKRGLFGSLYTDRGSHYWHTPAAGGQVDKARPTQFGRAMGELGIELIPSYSPEARGRSERWFGTVQGRLPQELKLEGIADMSSANRYLVESFWPRMNRRFGVEARERGSAFVALGDVDLDDILCIKEERTVTRDNCVGYRGLSLQLPVTHGRHYVKRRVRVCEHADGTLSVFHGPRRLARYDAGGAAPGAMLPVAAG